MEKVTAYRASDGSLHATPEAAQRVNDSKLIAPLLTILDNTMDRAGKANLLRGYGLLAFIRENWDAISVFKPNGK